ncbi:NAD(P)H-dependent FMN reductase [Pseudovibrio ascidiaceicola]|uniref:NAD(P)H-dependent FMN reductase n=1 Tax=Pseudovibrio ascidiaceicola TaxID=285279 RepID=A0A1I3VLH3_9HYPH|nr:NAD(P)H-dependent oxidoreductase [Pseudovibrio ascidiaceicola]SFJ96085.1 NAD(P)H-dependent FMN reductase [Pseudovibrio ascidiaceicola]
MKPKILVFSGSTRRGSYNKMLAELMAKHLTIANAEVTTISLADYPLPIYDGDLEDDTGIPENAFKLRKLIETHHGIFIASPEYNSSITPLLKNTLDWISRIQLPEEEPLQLFHKSIYAVGGASPGAHGSLRGLMHLRTIMEVSLGCLVLPEMVSINFAGKSFDENGDLTKDHQIKRLHKLVDRFVSEASHVKLQDN